MPEYSIKVSNLDESPRALTYPIRQPWLAGELTGTDLNPGPEDGQVAIEAHCSGDDVIITGRASTTILAPCARCLEDVGIAVTANLSLLMCPGGPDHRTPPDEAELTPEEIAREFFTGDEIVLDDIVRESLILEIPMQPHCQRAECIARWEAKAEAGDGEAAIDPRLSPLLELKKKLSEP